jgi:tryptophanyl-tRNA synthetase
MTCNPFNVTGTIDYNKLICQFGAQPISQELIERFEKVTGTKAHKFLKRGIIISHRDLDKILDNIEGGKEIYLYTGRGPSSDSLHTGHLIPLMFTKYLQDALKCKLVIQMTTDEKYLFKDLTLDQVRQMCYNNIKDIIAVGFDPKKTFIFDNLDYIQKLYPTILQLQKHININKLQSCFGFDSSDNVGKYMFPAIQIAPCFASCFEGFIDPNAVCLVPCAIDQDNYFRLARDIVTFGKKPALIHTRFLPSFKGETKMSSSVGDALFVNSTEKQIVKAVKGCVSGGGETLELQRLHGADLSKDAAYQYLYIFLDDDEELERIARDYSSGKMLTGEVKNLLINVLKDVFSQYQQKRNTVTDEDVKVFMSLEK